MKVALFFSFNVSLQAWARNGSLERDCRLYRELVRRGHEVAFVSYGGEEDRRFLPEEWGIRILTRPPGLSSFDYAWQIPWIHGRELARMDMIKSHQNHGALAAAWCCYWLGKPYHARCGYLRSVFLEKSGADGWARTSAWIEEAISFHAAGAVSIPSPAEAGYAARSCRVPISRFRVAPNWIDTAVFRPDPVRRRARKLAFVGRLHPQKQPLVFLEIVHKLRDMGVEAVMIGEGELEKKVAEKISARNLPVERHKRLPNELIVEHLQSSSVYVLPTLYEGGSPKTLLEAMSCGLPVVSTNGFGAREAFLPGVHGFQCDPADAGAMEQAVRRLLAEPTLAEKMGTEGRRHIQTDYSVEAALGREEKIMEELMPP